MSSNAPTPQPSAWTHASAFAAGAAVVLIGALDLFFGHHLGNTGDLEVIALGLAALGVKATGALG
jgi:hypothetical protein